MPQIEILDQHTIDKIAAGEVIERPASVVKELVENAIDASATAITVEIKEGGISFIRITDNGCGIEKEQVPLAFLRHSTSKIRQAEDLLTVTSLGFRGEALSSIAAISQVELITKTRTAVSGSRYLVEGGAQQSLEEIGAPEGTTFLVRNLFYNTPARRKFLKTPSTEAGYINDLMERLTLSHAEISFKFIVNGQVRLHTSGNSNLKEIIYHIYGRDIAANLLEIHTKEDGFTIDGFIGKPLISRGNRNYETYFINGRYIKSSLIAKGIEDGYQSFVMQHKYPFTVLHLAIQGQRLDVNVHPTKMELRFSNQEQIYEGIKAAVRQAINQGELVYQAALQKEEKKLPLSSKKDKSIPEPFEKKRLEAIKTAIQKDSPYEKKYERTDHRPKDIEPKAQPQPSSSMQAAAQPVPTPPMQAAAQPVSAPPMQAAAQQVPTPPMQAAALPLTPSAHEDQPTMTKTTYEQATLDNLTVAEAPVSYGNRLLEQTSRKYHTVLGQLFDTYWLVQFEDNLYIIDQHAAHERVLYERMLASLETKEFTSQNLYPPILISVSMQEESLLKKYQAYFEKLGFVLEYFGGKEYSITAVPANLFGLNGKNLMLEILDGLTEFHGKEKPQIVTEKIASMSCKAAVKGNQRISRAEIDALIDELLTLENPYHCPHGRPTIISMSKYELEKKFKRVL